MSERLKNLLPYGGNYDGLYTGNISGAYQPSPEAFRCVLCTEYCTDVLRCQINMDHICCTSCVGINGGKCPICYPYQCIMCYRTGTNMCYCKKNNSHHFCPDCAEATRGFCFICYNLVCVGCSNYIIYNDLVMTDNGEHMHRECYINYFQNNQYY